MSTSLKITLFGTLESIVEGNNLYFESGWINCKINYIELGYLIANDCLLFTIHLFTALSTSPSYSLRDISIYWLIYPKVNNCRLTIPKLYISHF